MPTVDLFGDWRARFYQVRLWDYLTAGGLRAMPIWPRRAGKDDVSLQWAKVSMVRRPATYWHMLPLKEQARTAIWSAVNPHTGRRRIDETFPDKLFEKRETDMMVMSRFNAATWQVKGSDNFGAGIGSPPAGIVFSEYSRADPQAWAFLRPILVENGGWALFPSTPFGHNHFERMYHYARSEEGQRDGWFVERLTAEQTLHLLKPEEQQAFIDGTLSVDQAQKLTRDILSRELRELAAEIGSLKEAVAIIDQEYYCSFNASIPGSYYGDVLEDAEKEDPSRVGVVPHETNLPVVAAFDLGHADSTAIWWAQLVGLQVRIVDYYEQSGVSDIGFYADVLNGNCSQVSPADNRRRAKYRYGRHGIILPHDAGHERLGMSKSIRRQFDDFGFSTKLLPIADIDPGIRAARNLIRKAWFDQKNCARGLDCLRNYHRQKDESRNAYVERPEHDWSSHGADAFRYLALGWDPSVRPERLFSEAGQRNRAAVQSRQYDPDYDPWRLPSR